MEEITEMLPGMFICSSWICRQILFLKGLTVGLYNDVYFIPFCPCWFSQSDLSPANTTLTPGFT